MRCVLLNARLKLGSPSGAGHQHSAEPMGVVQTDPTSKHGSGAGAGIAFEVAMKRANSDVINRVRIIWDDMISQCR